MNISAVSKRHLLFLPRNSTLTATAGRFRAASWNGTITVTEPCGALVATVTKELFHWTDTYVIDVVNPADALRALMLVLAIDAEKCSRSN